MPTNDDFVPDKPVAGFVPDPQTQAAPSPYTEAGAAANPALAPAARGVLARPAMPGVSSRFAGPQSKALTPENRASRDIPMDVAKVAAPTALSIAAPEAMFPGAVASGLARGMGALGGASYGGRLATEAGLPKWSGQVVGGATGLFAPEVINKLGGPLLSRIASMMGKSAPVAESAAEGAEIGSDVLHAPIKSGPFPNRPPGNIQNVPRALLPGIAERTGDPAAVAEISRVTGKPALYVGEDYPGARAGSRMVAGDAAPIRGGAPSISSELPPYKIQTVEDVSKGTEAVSNAPSWEGELPQIDELALQFEAKGSTRADANRLAEETLNEASLPDNPYSANDITKRQALTRIARIMGPEMRRTPR